MRWPSRRTFFTVHLFDIVERRDCAMKNFFDYLRAGEIPREVVYDRSKYNTFMAFLVTSPYFKTFSDEMTTVEERVQFDLPDVVECHSALSLADVSTMIKNQDHLDYLLRSLVDKLLREEDTYESVFAALLDYYYMVRNYNRFPLNTVH
ncbi:hypothetical protein HOV30_gp006 [Erwinia phage Derbicus]|uniref:Uncharacterized protein n=2 Tax=Derbicusvirus derbicus TaxID=2734104 RepID=A0A482IJ53_9CAUD|nr:hypothetical protein BIZ82_gp006 [Erwinia phage vB_EamM_EarlPhillipIV]YP_009821050.1 hypothetical protein HOV30_gp006 [Erwinia phage Derbicus]ANZ48856.1 hypothetical protein EARLPHILLIPIV_6 [Erwinia phage vB_EamM_EarlPhillipIV]QBP07433.1 hypothetical protein DERBICUS_6 [Erwinia phage Derbicus]